MANSPESMVREFHQKYGHFEGLTSILVEDIPIEVRNLRNRLISEEYTELMKGMMELNTIEIADGIADLIYVLIGTAISFGMPIDRLFQEVHRSNMTKTPVKAEGGAKYGTKTPKGPDFQPPHIHRILFEPERKTQLELKAEDRCND